MSSCDPQFDQMTYAMEDLAELKANGTYQKMLNYWSLYNPAYSKDKGVLSR